MNTKSGVRVGAVGAVVSHEALRGNLTRKGSQFKSRELSACAGYMPTYNPGLAEVEVGHGIKSLLWDQQLT